VNFRLYALAVKLVDDAEKAMEWDLGLDEAAWF